MPISANPDATFDFVLTIDREKPPDTWPAFIARFGTRRQHERYAALVEQAAQAPTAGECHRIAAEALAVAYAGCRNVTTPDGKPWEFSAADIGDVCTDVEVWELLDGYIRAARLAEIDRKKSVLPARSAAISSAETVAAPANASPATTA